MFESVLVRYLRQSNRDNFFFFFELATFTVNTTVPSAWTTSNPTYTRPSGTNETYYYDTFNLMVYTTGVYAIGSNSNIDTYGCLYNGTFVPEIPVLNSMICVDDGDTGGQFRFEQHLRSNIVYTLVATTYIARQTGPYTIVVSGPTRVILTQTTFTGTSVTPLTTGSGNTTSQTRKFLAIQFRMIYFQHLI